MKRGDQHPVSVDSTDKVAEAKILSQEATGVVSPAEKESFIPMQEEKPTMGALPVDTPGGVKHSTEWQSVTGDESHESKIYNEETDPATGDDDSIVATGSGPDPEHMDDGL